MYLWCGNLYPLNTKFKDFYNSLFKDILALNSFLLFVHKQVVWLIMSLFIFIAVAVCFAHETGEKRLFVRGDYNGKVVLSLTVLIF